MTTREPPPAVRRLVGTATLLVALTAAAGTAPTATRAHSPAPAAAPARAVYVTGGPAESLRQSQQAIAELLQAPVDFGPGTTLKVTVPAALTPAARAGSSPRAMSATNAALTTAMTRLGAGRAARTAVRFALDHLGDPYQWAATGPHRWDCSGLTQASYAHAQITIPRVAADQAQTGTAVPLRQLLPGDLLFWAYDTIDPSSIHHVALYIGRGLVVQAPQTGDVVKVSPLWLDGYAGAVRVVPGTGPSTHLAAPGIGPDGRVIKARKAPRTVHSKAPKPAPQSGTPTIEQTATPPARPPSPTTPGRPTTTPSSTKPSLPAPPSAPPRTTSTAPPPPVPTPRPVPSVPAPTTPPPAASPPPVPPPPTSPPATQPPVTPTSPAAPTGSATTSTPSTSGTESPS